MGQRSGDDSRPKSAARRARSKRWGECERVQHQIRLPLSPSMWPNNAATFFWTSITSMALSRRSCRRPFCTVSLAMCSASTLLRSALGRAFAVSAQPSPTPRAGAAKCSGPTSTRLRDAAAHLSSRASCSGPPQPACGASRRYKNPAAWPAGPPPWWCQTSSAGTPNLAHLHAPYGLLARRRVKTKVFDASIAALGGRSNDIPTSLLINYTE